MANLQERLAATHAATQSIVEDLCGTPWLSLRKSAESFHAVLHRSVSATILDGSSGSQFWGKAALDGITLCFLERAALDNGDDFAKSRDVIDPLPDRKVIKL